jgi:CHAT domain-containing protein
MFLEDIKPDIEMTLGIETKRMLDNPLLRSGLFFAGSNNLVSGDGEFNISGEESSLLTSYEVMNLELDRTELVVLSACETGLGVVKNGEGVFGLRRAFQQAGARSVLMSLWAVDDKATQELMSNFYNYWLSGMTKREAFHRTQLDILKKFRYPYYWGAFVMVGE